MTDYQKYTLIQDQDYHWYLCPWEKRGEANEYLDAVSEYWSSGWEKKGEIEPIRPNWLKDIDGPHMLSFSNPIEE